MRWRARPRFIGIRTRRPASSRESVFLGMVGLWEASLKTSCDYVKHRVHRPFSIPMPIRWMMSGIVVPVSVSRRSISEQNRAESASSIAESAKSVIVTSNGPDIYLLMDLRSNPTVTMCLLSFGQGFINGRYAEGRFQVHLR